MFGLRFTLMDFMMGRTSLKSAYFGISIGRVSLPDRIPWQLFALALSPKYRSFTMQIFGLTIRREPEVYNWEGDYFMKWDVRYVAGKTAKEVNQQPITDQWFWKLKARICFEFDLHKHMPDRFEEYVDYINKHYTLI
jgi:hypothetical protein